MGRYKGLKGLLLILKKIIIVLMIIGALFVSTSMIYYFFFQKIEFLMFDFKQRVSTIAEDPQIVIIEISDDSIDKIGRWPWHRDWHAALVTVLKKYGAKAVVYDVIFGEPDIDKYDAFFEKAIGLAGNVYLPVILKCDNVLTQPKPYALYGNLPNLERAAKKIGHVVAIPDMDGAIRQVPLFLDFEGKTYPSMAYAVAEEVIEDFDEIKKNITVTPFGSMLVRWAGAWEKTFIHYSFADIVKSYQMIQQGKPPLVNLEDLKDKICFVGITATGLGELKSSPMQHSYPGVGYHANMYNTIVQNRFVKEASVSVEIVIVLCIICFVLFTTIKLDPTKELLLLGFVGVVYTIVDVLLFKYFDLNVTYMYAMISMLFPYFMVNGYKQFILARDRKRLMTIATTDELTGVYNVRYFREVMNHIIKTKALYTQYLGDKTFCLAMCDVDKFKTFNDTYGHQVGDAVLKSFAKVMHQNVRGLDIVARYGGEEFVIVLFGIELEDAKEAVDKIRAAVEANVIRFEGKDYQMTASYGVSAFVKGKDDVMSMVKRADDALYVAKETGRNKVCTENEKNDSKEEVVI